MEATIQALFRRDFSAHSRAHRLPIHLHKAAGSIMRCRTAAMGGHVMACKAGHIAGVWYNSCRHRACPQCAKLQIDRWLEGWRRRLLPSDHFHVVFTIPHDLLELWQANRQRLSGHLFRAARETLFELLADEKYLGAQPGVIAALHTWGRTLTLHPHLHCLVTAGGVLPDGRWRASKGGYLLPVRVVKAMFRGKMMHRIRRDLERDELVVPPHLSEAQLSNLLRRSHAKRWNVRLQERYSHGHGVISYLARYVRGGPIRNRRILRITAEGVSFSYVDHRDRRRKTMTLTSDEFMRRLLWHVPEPRSHVVRHYGLYARRAAERAEACRSSLCSSATSGSPPCAAANAKMLPLCKICGHPLGRTRELAPVSGCLPGTELPSQFKFP